MGLALDVEKLTEDRPPLVICGSEVLARLGLVGMRPFIGGVRGAALGASNASFAASLPGGLRYGLQQEARGACVGASNNFADFVDQYPEHWMVVTDTTSRSRSVLTLRDGIEFYKKKVFEKQSGTNLSSDMIERMVDGHQFQSHGFIYTIELRASSTSNTAVFPSVVVGPWYLVNNVAPPFVNEPGTVTGFLTAHNRGLLTIIGHQVLQQLKMDPKVVKIFTTQAFAFGLLEKNKPGRVLSDLDVLMEEVQLILKNNGFSNDQIRNIRHTKRSLLTSGNHFSKLLDTAFIFVAHQGVGPTRAKKSSNGVKKKSGAYKSKSKKSKSKSSRKSSKSSEVKTSSSSSAKAGSKRSRDEEDDEGEDDDDDEEDDDEEDDEEDDDEDDED